MKKKFLLDIILFITLVLSMFYNFTGNIIHEVIGLIIFISLILHLTLNYSFIKTILKRKKITINIIINKQETIKISLLLFFFRFNIKHMPIDIY